jgi:hypothetical protein
MYSTRSLAQRKYHIEMQLKSIIIQNAKGIYIGTACGLGFADVSIQTASLSFISN